MSDRELLNELLEFIDSISAVNHYNNLQRKADEIRTRMAEQRCATCKFSDAIYPCKECCIINKYILKWQPKEKKDGN